MGEFSDGYIHVLDCLRSINNFIVMFNMLKKRNKKDSKFNLEDTSVAKYCSRGKSYVERNFLC